MAGVLVSLPPSRRVSCIVQRQDRGTVLKAAQESLVRMCSLLIFKVGVANTFS